jgi:hypothetical protein
MSCLGPKYDPVPPRVWSRVQGQCTYPLPLSNSNPNTAYIPILKKNIPFGDVQYELQMIQKGNILQYKKNDGNMSKQQRYAQMARGAWTRKKAWATQSQTYTNPNIDSLERVNIQGTISVPPTTTNNIFSYCPQQQPQIPNGGSLICTTIVNPCNNQDVIKKNNPNYCYPTSASNVPGPIKNLCWKNSWQTWYPKQRYFMTSQGNKFPVNYKGLVSANSIPSVNSIPMATNLTRYQHINMKLNINEINDNITTDGFNYNDFNYNDFNYDFYTSTDPTLSLEDDNADIEQYLSTI